MTTETLCLNDSVALQKQGILTRINGKLGPVSTHKVVASLLSKETIPGLARSTNAFYDGAKSEAMVIQEVLLCTTREALCLVLGYEEDPSDSNLQQASKDFQTLTGMQFRFYLSHTVEGKHAQARVDLGVELYTVFNTEIQINPGKHSSLFVPMFAKANDPRSTLQINSLRKRLLGRQLPCVGDVRSSTIKGVHGIHIQLVNEKGILINDPTIPSTYGDAQLNINVGILANILLLGEQTIYTLYGEELKKNHAFHVAGKIVSKMRAKNEALKAKVARLTA